MAPFSNLVVQIRLDTSRVLGGLGIVRRSGRVRDWMEQTRADRQAVVRALENDYDAALRRADSRFWKFGAWMLLGAIVLTLLAAINSWPHGSWVN
jgi:hypothetical protein